jgi:hypothetical protein
MMTYMQFWYVAAFLEGEIFQTDVEKSKSHFTFSNFPPPTPTTTPTPTPGIRGLYEMMDENVLQPDRPQVTL